jgi:hypothetical protein
MHTSQVTQRLLTHGLLLYCTHTALTQWEREVQLFVGMKRIRLFKLFASWKAFKLWRLAVLGLKQASACRTLTKKLLLLEPVFQQPLQQVHAACHELQQLRLHCLKRGQVSVANRLGCSTALLSQLWPS